jgi:hypothetical protein
MAGRNSEKSRLLQTTEEKADDANDRSRRATQLAVAAIIIALLGAVAGIVVGAVLGGINDSKINSLRADLDLLWSETQSALDQERNLTDSQLQGNLTAQYNTLHSQILLLQANAFDAIMNVSGGGGSPYTRTNVQNGTFNWKNNFETIVISANYSLDLVSIGPLNFQLLTLNPPSQPFLMEPGFNGNFFFFLREFNPSIPQLVRAPQDVVDTNSIQFPLTSANIGKISVTNDGGCFSNFFGISPPAPSPVSPYCFESGLISNDYASTALHSLTLSSDNLSLGREYYLAGKIVYVPNTHLDGQTFTLSSPWELVLDAF